MTLGTFHLWVLLAHDIYVYLSLSPPFSPSLFCGQLEVSIDAALLHKPLEPLTVCAFYCFMMWNGAASWTNTRWGIVGTNLAVCVCVWNDDVRLKSLCVLDCWSFGWASLSWSTVPITVINAQKSYQTGSVYVSTISFQHWMTAASMNKQVFIFQIWCMWRTRYC